MKKIFTFILFVFVTISIFAQNKSFGEFFVNKVSPERDSISKIAELKNIPFIFYEFSSYPDTIGNRDRWNRINDLNPNSGYFIPSVYINRIGLSNYNMLNPEKWDELINSSPYYSLQTNITSRQITLYPKKLIQLNFSFTNNEHFNIEDIGDSTRFIVMLTKTDSIKHRFIKIIYDDTYPKTVYDENNKPKIVKTPVPFSYTIDMPANLDEFELTSVMETYLYEKKWDNDGEIYHMYEKRSIIGVDQVSIKSTMDLSGTENVQLSDIMVYPNPVKDQLTIYSPNNPINTIKIIDISGKLISSKIIDGGLMTYDYHLDCLPGIYFVFVNNNRPIKIIKQ